MRQRLTVIIPCKNEARHLRGCVRSARNVADEVLVADSGSNDATLDIAKSLGCRVIQREYRTSGDFKNWAIPHASHPWVLILDADERLSDQLAEEIRLRLASDPEADGYRLRRTNYFFGREVRHGAWRPTRLTRLFRRDLGQYVGATDHADVEVATGQVGELDSPLLHDSIESYASYLRKMHRYADVQARLWRDEGREPSFPQLLFRAPLLFVQDYVLRGGFREGSVGLQCAALVAFGSYLKQARLWELCCGEQGDQTPVDWEYRQLPNSTLATSNHDHAKCPAA